MVHLVECGYSNGLVPVLAEIFTCCLLRERNGCFDVGTLGIVRHAFSVTY